MFGLIHKHKRIAIAFIAVASFSFLFWMFSVSDIRQMLSGNPCVATVKGECITVREFRFELLKFAGLLDREGMREVVKNFVLSSLITREVLYLKAKELGLYVSDEEILEEIKKMEEFKENGKFSVEKYREILQRLNITPEEYEEILRKSLMALRVNKLVEFGTYVLPEELEIQKTFESALISGKLYLVRPKDVKLEYEPTEEEIKAYYEKHKEAFREKSEKLYYVWELKDKEKVKEIYKAIKEGKIPEGYTKPPEKFKETLEKLKEGEVKILKDNGTYYVLYYKGVKEGRLKSLEEVKEEIKKRLVEEKKREKLREYAEKLMEKLRKEEKVEIKPIKFEKEDFDGLRRIMNLGNRDILLILFGKDMVKGVYPVFGGYAILVVEKVEHKELGERELKEIKERIKGTKSEDLTRLLVNRLVERYGAKVNRELIDRF
ncbi:SurA N-terminal domain-containing protein [Aquifex pyrophilus]